MRLVLDTNVLIAALVADGLCRDLVRRRLHGHELCTSQALIDELAQKLKTKFKTDASEVPLLLLYRERARMVVPSPLPKAVCRDPDDDRVLATALAAKAEAIVSGDLDLLALRSFCGILIYSPRQFLEFLEGE